MATNVLALELGPSGVRANSISPTVTLTAMGQKVWLDQPEKAAPMLDRIPFGGSPSLARCRRRRCGWRPSSSAW